MTEAASTDAFDNVEPAYDVVLTDSGGKLMGVIKVVRSQTRLSLHDAKALAEQGGRVGAAMNRDAAERFAAELAKVGATAEVVDADGTSIEMSIPDEIEPDDDPRIDDPLFRKLRGRVKKAVLQNLREGEQVKVVVRGAHGQAMVGTQSRVLVCKPGFMAGASFGSEVSSWQFRNLVGVQVHKGLMSGSIILQAPGQSGTSTSYWGQKDSDPSKAPNAIPIVGDWGEVKPAAARLQHLIDEAQAQATQPMAAAVSAPAKSMAEELRELAELRNAGVLDEEEFRAAKQRLIGG